MFHILEVIIKDEMIYILLDENDNVVLCCTYDELISLYNVVCLTLGGSKNGK